jgi:hypothetical protein
VSPNEPGSKLFFVWRRIFHCNSKFSFLALVWLGLWKYGLPIAIRVVYNFPCIGIRVENIFLWS